MRLFNKVAIIGVGLIGGSIGLAIKKKRVAKEVIGVFRHKATLKRSLKAKAVDRGSMSIAEGVKDAGIIIIASPVRSIPALVYEAARHAKKGAIITDVGSTKVWIIDEVEGKLNGGTGVYFVGSHPMAGSERTGVEFARYDLFENAPCIVTATPKTNTAARKKIVDFWALLGSKVQVMTPAAHDRSVSLISHLPHIVGFSLAGSVPEKELVHAAEGFRDTTRVASSDPRLWADIFLTNRKEILRSGQVFEKYYRRILKAIAGGDYRKVVNMLKQAKVKRDRLSDGRKGR